LIFYNKISVCEDPVENAICDANNGLCVITGQ
jgi:hypothetical protein